MDGWTVEPLWKGERCFIIAGGQTAPRTWSALRFNGKANSGRVIAIKDAALLHPKADVFFYADGKKEGRFDVFRPDVWKAFTGAMRIRRGVDPKQPEGVIQVRRQRKSNRELNGLCLDPARLGGHCCGGSALNLAFHLGAKEIILVGYDLAGGHWNERHPERWALSSIHARHRRSIEAMAQPLKIHGVHVINTSPISSLEAFQRADIRTL